MKYRCAEFDLFVIIRNLYTTTANRGTISIFKGGNLRGENQINEKSEPNACKINQ